MESNKDESDCRVVRKGTWTKEEDILLKKCIDKYGEGKWHLVPLRAGLKRCRKSCRLRWLNYLRPNIKRGQFTKDEIDLIIRLHNLLGNRWSLIAGRLPGRTANDIKNFWNTRMEKKPMKKGHNKTVDKYRSTLTIRPRTYSLTKPTIPNNCPHPRDRETGNIHQDKVQENCCSEGSGAAAASSSETTGGLIMDECIRWWSNLLEQTSSENGDALIGPFSFPLDENVDNPTEIAWTSS